MYLALRDEQRRLEEERREMDLVRRLLRQGDYELRLAAHLTDIKRQKQIIVRNRLEKDQQLQVSGCHPTGGSGLVPEDSGHGYRLTKWLVLCKKLRVTYQEQATFIWGGLMPAK